MAEFGTGLSRPVRISEMAYSFDALDQNPAALVELGLRLDPLRTLIVGEETDAAAIADVVDAGEISHVVVRSKGGSLSGIIAVDWATGQVAANLDAQVTDFQSAVAAILRTGLRNDSYHHEFLTAVRPPLIYCRGGHWANADPCERHKK
ncbi:MAG: hypothetical protein WDN23_14575 [Edaphobacter sp.]